MRIDAAFWTTPSVFFWALSVPIGLASLLRYLLAVRHTPAPSETLLVKVLGVGKKKFLEATCR